MTYTGQVDIDGEGTDRKYGTYVDIGADEVYSCDEPLTEDNISNDLDWNADGIVNLHEFSKFSAAWLSHDPNDPAWLADPNLADPNLSEGWYEWKYICNLDATGDSQYTIDLADFSLFCDEWLWAACWKLEQINEAMVMFGGESMMMTLPLSMDVMSFEMEAQPADKTEPEISADTLVEIIVLLDEYLAEQPDNAENIEEMRAFLIDKLKAILEK